MKHTATLEDANHSLDEAVSTLQNHLSKVDQNEPEQLKLANEYYKNHSRYHLLHSRTSSSHPVSNGFARKSRLLYQNTTVMIRKQIHMLFLSKNRVFPAKILK